MALNEIKRDADSFSVACTSAVNSGELVALASGLAGVAEVDAHLGEDGSTYYTTIRTVGIWSIPVASHATPTIGESVTVTLPSAGPAAPVTLAATGTKVGTIVGLPKGGTHLYVAINK
jgi:predicted RecA/RadA family phage recombinase